MNIIALKEHPATLKDAKLNKAYNQFKELAEELKDKELPVGVIENINQNIEALNSSSDLESGDLRKLFRQNQSKIIKQVRDKLKIVTKNYYRNLWMAVGMAAFGIPIGTAFGLGTGNMGMLGIGLPIGMTIGMAIGIAMDNEALKQGRQLNIELKC